MVKRKNHWLITLLFVCILSVLAFWSPKEGAVEIASACCKSFLGFGPTDGGLLLWGEIRVDNLPREGAIVTVSDPSQPELSVSACTYGIDFYDSVCPSHFLDDGARRTIHDAPFYLMDVTSFMNTYGNYSVPVELQMTVVYTTSLGQVYQVQEPIILERGLFRYNKQHRLDVSLPSSNNQQQELSMDESSWPSLDNVVIQNGVLTLPSSTYLTIEDVTIFEGASLAEVMVSLTGNPLNEELVVDYQTNELGSAVGSASCVIDTDYITQSGTLVWQPQETSTRIITVEICDDSFYEMDETFMIELLNPTPSEIIISEPATITITDDDSLSEVSIITPTLAINEDAGYLQVEVAVDIASGIPITAQLAIRDGTAQAGLDYEIPAELIVNWDTGESGSKFINIPINNDVIFESNTDETLTVEIVSSNASVAGNSMQTYEIDDNDAHPLITLSNVTVVEGSGNAIVEATMIGGHYQGVTIECQTNDGTAVANGSYNSDYDAYTSQNPLLFTWLPNQANTVASSSIMINDDPIDESDEQFTLANCSISVGSIDNNVNALDATITIQDDGDVATLTIQDETVVEDENGGLPQAQVTVMLSGGHENGVTVDYDTLLSVGDLARENGSCNSGSVWYDFNDESGSLSWANDEFNTAQIIIIDICDDPIYEPTDETFTVELSNPSNATINKAQSTVTIEDDDVAPTLSITPLSVDENNTTANFTLQMNGGVSSLVEGRYRTVNDSATAGVDFTFVDASWAFPANEKNPSAILSVPILEDEIVEGNETFDIELYNIPSSINMIDPSPISIQILDNESSPNITASNVTVQESFGGTVYITVNMDAPCPNPVTVYYTTQAGTADTDDFTPTSSSETWPAFTSGNRTFNIPVLTDNVYEPGEDETFIVNFSLDSPSCAKFPSGTLSITVSIEDSDVPPTISLSPIVGPFSVVEGQSIQFNAVLSGESDEAITVDYATVNGSAENGDYSLGGSMLTWPANSTANRIITINATDDIFYETSENFDLVLQNPTNAELGTPNTQGITIIDNDASQTIPTINFASPYPIAMPEGSLFVNQAYEVQLISSVTSTQNITIFYQTIDGTADELDYSPSQNDGLQSIILPSGQTTTQIPITILWDFNFFEENEIFQIILHSIDGEARLGTNITQTVGIGEEPPPLPLDISMASETVTVEEGDSFALNVSMGTAYSQPITVTYELIDISTNSMDHIDNGVGYVVIPPGSTSLTLPTINIIDDPIFEQEQIVKVKLISATDGQHPISLVSSSETTVTILDNEPTPVIQFSSLAPATMPEGELFVNQYYNLSIVSSVPSEYPITVSYSGADGTAGSDDYFPGQADGIQTIDIPSTQITASIPVTIYWDFNFFESAEIFAIVLSSASGGATIGNNNTKPVTIDDLSAPLPPDVSMVSPTANGNEPDTVDVVVTLAMTHVLPITVEYDILNITTSDFDYDPNNSGILVIPAGSLTGTIQMTLLEDSLPESNETFRILLTDATNGSRPATITAQNETVVTIFNNDIEIQVLGPFSFKEPAGNGDNNNPPNGWIESHQEIVVSLSVAPSYPITITYVFEGDNTTLPPPEPSLPLTITYGIAIYGSASDYSGDCEYPYSTSYPRSDFYSPYGQSGHIVFGAGEISKTIPIHIQGNCTDSSGGNREQDFEFFYLNIGATYPTCSHGRVVCNDMPRVEMSVESCYANDPDCPANDLVAPNNGLQAIPHQPDTIPSGQDKRPLAKQETGYQTLLQAQSINGQATSVLLTPSPLHEWETLTITTFIPEQTSILATLIDDNQQPIAGFVNIPLQGGMNPLDLTSLGEQAVKVQLDLASQNSLVRPQVTGVSMQWVGTEQTQATTHRFAGVLSDGRWGRLSQARVELWQVGEQSPIASTTSRIDGTYQLPDFMPDPEAVYQVRVPLVYERQGQMVFEVYHAEGTEPVYLQSPPFQLNPDTVFTTHLRHFDFIQHAEIYEHNLGWHSERLDDLAAIYVHTGQVMDFAFASLGMTNISPLTVQAFSNRTGVIYDHLEHTVYYDEFASAYFHGNRPMNREWHETFHHLMAVSMNGMPQADCDNPTTYLYNNHGGYDNCSTADSWAEGWANYWSTVLGASLNWQNRSDLYQIGTFWGYYDLIPLEDNWKAWDRDCYYVCPSREEFAVAGILVDITDPINPYDDDYVHISVTQLWDLFSNQQPDNMYQVYHLLRQAGVGQTQQNQHDCNVTDLDLVFIAHGFFFDENWSFTYDCGEEVGRATNGARPGRAHPINQPAHYHAVPMSPKFIEISSEVGFPITVTVSYEYPDAPYRNFQYETPSHDGLLYIEPHLGEDTIQITVSGYTDEAVATQPLTFTNHTYSDWIAQSGQNISDPIYNHNLGMQEGHHIPLQQGWNLVSLGLGETTRPITDVLASVMPHVELVYTFDCQAQNPWRRYDPTPDPFASPNTLTNVSPQTALWVQMNITQTLMITGTPTIQTNQPLCEGWNLVPYLGTESVPIEDALISIMDWTTIVYGYDADDLDDPWKRYDLNPSPFAQPNDLSVMGPQKGYWIHVTQETIWMRNP